MWHLCLLRGWMLLSFKFHRQSCLYFSFIQCQRINWSLQSGNENMSVDTSSWISLMFRCLFFYTFQWTDLQPGLIWCLQVNRGEAEREWPLCVADNNIQLPFKTLSVSYPTDFLRPLAQNQRADAQFENSELPTMRTDPSGYDERLLSAILLQHKGNVLKQRNYLHVITRHTVAFLTSFSWLFICGIQLRFISESDLVLRGSGDIVQISVMYEREGESAPGQSKLCWRGEFGIRLVLCSTVCLWGLTDSAKV